MYKILSLDGGGSWAILQLLTLKEKYGNVEGHQVLKDFDLVIANSGGSIVLAALAENWTLEKALSLFDKQELREQIFKKNSFRDTFFPVYFTRRFGMGPKYNASEKRKAFGRIFSKIDKMQMEELPKFIGKESLKIVVSTFDAINNRAKFFKSYGQEKDDFDSVKLTQAIHGSSNAPVQYFDFPARFKAKKTEVRYELWDGALGGFNNPVLAGLIEAFKLGIDLNNVKIISLGTGNKLISVKEKKRFYQLRSITQKERRNKFKFLRFHFQWKYFFKTVVNQANTILYNPPDWANYVTMIFLQLSKTENIKDRFIRLSPLVHVDKNTDPDSVELLDKLYTMDMDLTEDSEIELLKSCFQHWKKGKIVNQPIEFKVKRDNDLVYITGDKEFKEAIKKW